MVPVAHEREEGVPLKQVSKEFGISKTCLTNWLDAADREAGVTVGKNPDSADLREAKRRIRLLEQENEVLRRTAAHLLQANPPPR